MQLLKLSSLEEFVHGLTSTFSTVRRTLIIAHKDIIDTRITYVHTWNDVSDSDDDLEMKWEVDPPKSARDVDVATGENPGRTTESIGTPFHGGSGPPSPSVEGDVQRRLETKGDKLFFWPRVLVDFSNPRTPLTHCRLVFGIIVHLSLFDNKYKTIRGMNVT